MQKPNVWPLSRGRSAKRTRRFSNEFPAGAGRVSLTRLHVRFEGKHQIGTLH